MTRYTNRSRYSIHDYPAEVDAALYRDASAPHPWTPVGSIVVDGITYVPRHFAGRPHRRDRMHSGWHRDCIICTLPRATTHPVPCVCHGEPDYSGPARPWTPLGSLVVDGITRVPRPYWGKGWAVDWDAVNEAAESEAAVPELPRSAASKVVTVFEQARDRRHELAQIADPAIREALSLT